MSTRKKRYTEMTAAELAAETARFDEEFVIDKAQPMTDSQRQQWKRAKKKPGRPRVGEGAQPICVSLERKLLRRADKLAAALGISRAQLITTSLVQLLASETHRKKRGK